MGLPLAASKCSSLPLPNKVTHSVPSVPLPCGAVRCPPQCRLRSACPTRRRCVRACPNPCGRTTRCQICRSRFRRSTTACISKSFRCACPVARRPPDWTVNQIVPLHQLPACGGHRPRVLNSVTFPVDGSNRPIVPLPLPVYQTKPCPSTRRPCGGRRRAGSTL